VNTAEFFLAIGESGLASQQIKRAHALMNEVSKLPNASGKSVQQLVLRFKTCYARILDSERKFLEAALRYMELSQSSFEAVKDADRSQSLEYAVSCAILAKAGPPRSRVLAMLYSDERSKSLQNFSMLEKMFKERIIAAHEVDAFEKILQEHQKADTGSKRTVGTHAKQRTEAAEEVRTNPGLGSDCFVHSRVCFVLGSSKQCDRAQLARGQQDLSKHSLRSAGILARNQARRGTLSLSPRPPASSSLPCSAERCFSVLVLIVCCV
jgi:hypothetical protein